MGFPLQVIEKIDHQSLVSARVPAVGAGIGALSDSTKGRNLNLVVLGIMVVRLIIGGGII